MDTGIYIDIFLLHTLWWCKKAIIVSRAEGDEF